MHPLPSLAERLLGTVERFVERISVIAEDRVLALASRVMFCLFAFLLIGVGITFLLVGSVQIINAILPFPGVGQVIIGSLVLGVAGGVLLFSRCRI